MRLTIYALAIIAFVGCSDRNNPDWPRVLVPQPDGWEVDSLDQLGPLYRKTGDPDQSLRYLVLRFSKAPRLGEKQIREEIESLAKGGDVELEPLSDGTWFAESSAEEAEWSQLRIFRVRRISTIDAELHLAVYRHKAGQGSEDTAASLREKMRAQ